MIGTISILIPKFFIIHIIQLFHFSYLFYLAIKEFENSNLFSLNNFILIFYENYFI